MANIIPKLFQTVCMNYKMLEYDKIDISEGIDMNKTSESKECDICHYWQFSDKNFSYEPYICNGCHNLIQKATSFDNGAIVSIKSYSYRIHFWYMNKNDAINKMKNSNLRKVDHYDFFSLYIKDE